MIDKYVVWGDELGDEAKKDAGGEEANCQSHAYEVSISLQKMHKLLFCWFCLLLCCS